MNKLNLCTFLFPLANKNIMNLKFWGNNSQIALPMIVWWLGESCTFI